MNFLQLIWHKHVASTDKLWKEMKSLWNKISFDLLPISAIIINRKIYSFLFPLRRIFIQKQLFIDVLREKCSENMYQMYRRTPMPKCHFNTFEKQLYHGCFPVNLLHIFRTHFPKNTCRQLLLFYLIVNFFRTTCRSKM